MIERFPTIIFADGKVSDERAVLACGCAAYTGYHGKEPFIGFAPCSLAHEALTEHARMLYASSLSVPEARLAVEVADEVLDVAERYFAERSGA